MMDFFRRHDKTFVAIITATIAILLYQEGMNYVTYLKKRSALATFETEEKYNVQASKLVDYFYKQNVPVRFAVVKETLQQIDYFLPVYFPDGPFTAKDFIAMAIIESSFNQYLVGTSGEKGIFQIMEESSNWMGVKKNQFNIDVNTELGMFVLKEKFKQHQDYRKAIIAYNGVVKGANGRWSDVYWKRFSKAKTELDIIFREKK